MRTPEKTRLVDQTRQILEEAILAGRLRAGERLIETVIASELGVSRTTVRESFRMLERHGLVVSKPHRGTFVTRLSHSDAIDLGYARAMLEGFALIAEPGRIDEELIETLQGCLDDMKTCKLPRDLPRLVEIDLAFHGAIMDCAPLPRLIDLWASLNGQLGAVYIRGVEDFQMTVDDLVEFHQNLIDAIKTHDVDVALPAIIRHYVRVEGDETTHGSAIRTVIDALASGHIPPATNQVPTLPSSEPS